ncbi:MAG: HPr family phosphocarrier protein [Anaerolineales bacterium]|nr:HPr family phosphocarrier protein [Anaerolineales bacterium]MCW5839138.1 HPr family phosphocarrier protein [Anaerolineales bacterium]MCW5888063.1 HPr family phosphocarrier protein [Anaerolineales bacterium]
MTTLELTIINEVGLHARPAAQFVQQAAKFKADVQIRNLTSASAWVNAKSILSVLTLGVGKGQVIELQIDGEDEAEAAAALRQLVESDFAV